MTLGRDVRDDRASILDAYLDDLLASRPDGPVALDGPGGDIDPELAHVARTLRASLARFHPSFRFEERLAARLREASIAAATGHDTRGAAVSGLVIPFAPPGRQPRTRSRRVNGALIGGAISAGVSLASIAAGAIISRRRGRGDTPWERVV